MTCAPHASGHKKMEENKITDCEVRIKSSDTSVTVLWHYQFRRTI